MRHWVNNAIRLLEADKQRSADTHLFPLKIPKLVGIDLYLKDESSHPSGSLKHRLARSLFLYGLCNGQIHQHTAIVEASSGSTAISEAYFARLLGLRFIAVIPKTTARRKIEHITFYGGECHLVDSGDIYSAAKTLAGELDGHYMDQFTYAERATDWRGNNNIADSIFDQLSKEPHNEPQWIIVSAGTGGTSATIGRYLRYHEKATQLCVADPEHSVFFDYYKTGDKSLTLTQPSRIEGIGRPRVEPSFIRDIVDHMIKVPDGQAIAGVHVLESLINRKCGGSTGTNFIATLQMAAQMQIQDRPGSLVTMICDSGSRYLDTYYNHEWIEAAGIQDTFNQAHNDILEYLETGDAERFLANIAQ